MCVRLPETKEQMLNRWFKINDIEKDFAKQTNKLYQELIAPYQAEKKYLALCMFGGH